MNYLFAKNSLEWCRVGVKCIAKRTELTVINKGNCLKEF